MSEIKPVFGIDLGTTYSVIARIDEYGKPEVIKNLDNEPTTPSVVEICDDGKVVVGEAAKRNAVASPDRVISEIKRHMGDENYHLEIDGTRYRPEEISAFILRKLAQEAGEVLGVTVEDVVITVPAYFTDVRRTATRSAGELAGLHVLQIIEEPTAAALLYGADADEETVLVYDLGGGTFDITMIQVTEMKNQVVVTGGNFNLGGTDWDARIVEYIAAQFEAEHGVNPLDDPEAKQELVLKAEEAKKALTTRESTKISISFGERMTIELTREKFDELTSDLIEETVTLTRDLLEEAKKKGVTKVDRILLVGGSTRMPQVSEALEKNFDIELRRFDPDEAVAKGAAILALKISLDVDIARYLQEKGIDPEQATDEEKDEAADDAAERFSLPPDAVKKAVQKTITIVAPHSLGVVSLDKSRKEVVTTLIPAQRELPAKMTERFGTVDDDQETVLVRVMQGESEVVTDCHELGQGTFHLPAGLPAGSPIDVTFTFNNDGVLMIKAVELTQNRELEFEIERVGVMSKEEKQAASDAIQKADLS